MARGKWFLFLVRRGPGVSEGRNLIYGLPPYVTGNGKKLKPPPPGLKTPRGGLGVFTPGGPPKKNVLGGGDPFPRGFFPVNVKL